MSAQDGFFFFISDWRAEPSLRMSSLAARGLWLELLGIAREGKPFGFVTLHDGRAMTDEQIAALVGRPIEEVRDALRELEANGVFSRGGAGKIYSRRLVREEKKRRSSSEGGKKGGPASLEKQKGIHATRGGTRGGTRPPRRSPNLTKPVSPSEKHHTNPLRSSNEDQTKPNHAGPSEREKRTRAPEPETNSDLIDEAELELALRAYNHAAALQGWPQATSLTTQRRKQLSACMRLAAGIDGFRRAMDRAMKAPFFSLDFDRDEKHRDWKTTIDALTSEYHFTRLLEGTYDPAPSDPAPNIIDHPSRKRSAEP